MDKRPKIWYDYSKYLLRSISFDKKGYSTLIKHLHDTPFVWDYKLCPMDGNRAEDGKYQRYYFFKSIGLNDGDFPYSCSVLEMLIGFASRVGIEWLGYDDSDMGDHIDRIFWLFITNLGLNFYDDNHFDAKSVDDILQIWMERRYGNDGFGSILKLKRKVNEYKNLEMMKQFNIFIDQFNIKSTRDL